MIVICIILSVYGENFIIWAPLDALKLHHLIDFLLGDEVMKTSKKSGYIARHLGFGDTYKYLNLLKVFQ